MKEIIDQISQIDAIAFENEQKNKAALSVEKQKYENEIKKYHDEKLDAANSDAQIIYDQIVSKAKNEYQIQEEKIKKVSCQIEDNYLKVEKKILEEIFEKLFTV